MSEPILLVGNPEPSHIGAHFLRAAAALGLEVHLCDTREAFQGPIWRRRMDWWFRGHRPSRLRAFSQRVVDAARRTRPKWVLATGIAPLDAQALEVLGKLGASRMNYLTDDPWNPAHRAPWFLSALKHYDVMFSPRRANLPDLESLGISAAYVAFGYSPEAHFPDPPVTNLERDRYEADVMFAGGADDDRVQAVVPFLEAGLQVALYGGYWDRYTETKAHARGMLNIPELRRAVGSAKVSLGFVRRANRDGHSMRTFEVPAIGGCMLAEDTPDHRQLFGDDGEAVVYFNSMEDAVEKTKWLLADPAKRQELAATSHRIVTSGKHTYADRLGSMLAMVDSGRP